MGFSIESKIIPSFVSKSWLKPTLHRDGSLNDPTHPNAPPHIQVSQFSNEHVQIDSLMYMFDHHRYTK
jgi:hypothetical protein